MSKNKTVIGSSIVEIEHEFSMPFMAIVPGQPFVTPWFSNTAFERRNIYFRLYLSKEFYERYNRDDFKRKISLQVCSSEQRDAAIELEKEENSYCRVSAIFAETPFKLAESMVFSEVSIEISPVKMFTEDHLAGTRLKMPSEHSLGKWPFNYQEPKTIVSMTFKAQVDLFTIPPIARDGDEELRPAVTTTAGAAAMLGRLLEGGVLSDVRLRVGEEELRAHRCVLAAASPVFRRMFELESSAESLQGLVDVQGVRSEVMAAALGFLYGQELGAALDADTLCDLLVLAERYELLELKELCDEKLAMDDNADPLQLLTLAVRNNAPWLREAAVKRIARAPDRESIINSDTLKEVTMSHPDVALQLILRL